MFVRAGKGPGVVSGTLHNCLASLPASVLPRRLCAFCPSPVVHSFVPVP